jgi:hypothetical protein
LNAFATSCFNKPAWKVRGEPRIRATLFVPLFRPTGAKGRL